MRYDGMNEDEVNPKWKMSMISMDAIHVHVEEGGKHGKVKGNIALKINVYL
jgi:hypothetical protein